MIQPIAPAVVPPRRTRHPLRLTALIAVLLGALTAGALAQEAPASATGTPASDAPASPHPTRNVRVTVTLTDQLGSDRPVVRTAVLTVADGRQGMFRSVTRGTASTSEPPPMPGAPAVELPLSVDTHVTITPSNRVLLRLGFRYHVFGQAGRDDAAIRVSERELTENLTLLLPPGQKVVASESADAISDRSVKVEVQADILP